MSHRPRSGRLWVGLVGLLLLTLAPTLAALPLAKAQAGIQKKVVVIRHGAKLYQRSQGDEGKDAGFMSLYFLLEGEQGGRVPVTVGPGKDQPDGWLTKEGVVEWNTLQMINFEPQSGRELARIFKEAPCAEEFGLTGQPGRCAELGSEPKRTGKAKDNYNLLVPVFGRDRDNYRGGFVRVTADGPAVAPQAGNPDRGSGAPAGSARVGYDLILVVDATASMEKWFRPTTEALESFVDSVRQEIGSGELRTPFQVGLLLYRDRKRDGVRDCELGFLVRWEAELTADIASVARTLSSAERATCSSDEEAEAVLDGLSRALQDPKWNDGSFRVVLLVGDAPPHGTSDLDKNPLKLSIEDITKLAEERNVRFLTFKIGPNDTEAFKALAFNVKEANKGRFRGIEQGDPDVYKQQLLAALREEWKLVMETNRLAAQGVSAGQLANDPGLAAAGIDAIDLPVIVANLPATAGGTPPPEFVEGWVPRKVKDKLAVGEYVFLAKTQASNFANIVETIANAAEEGRREGADAFIQNLRNSIAAMLGLAPDQVFRSGESLEGMLEKAEILPFKTQVLAFSAEEVNAWKPADFERLNKLLGEKVKVLRDFVQRPSHARLFGDKPFVYVPRDLFP
jgi:hypothetical protein